MPNLCYEEEKKTEKKETEAIKAVESNILGIGNDYIFKKSMQREAIDFFFF